MNVRYERVSQRCQQEALVEDGVDGLFGHDPRLRQNVLLCFAHLLHGEGLLFLGEFDPPDLAEASLP